LKASKVVFLVFLITSLCAVNGQLVRANPKTIVVPDDYPTIATAIENASDGDTILVRSGTYNETLIINKSISLMGENAGNTVLNGPSVYNSTFLSSVAIQVAANNVKISGLTIDNGVGLGVYVEISTEETQIVGNILNCGTAVSIFGSNAVVKENIISGYSTAILCVGAYCNITNNNILFSPGYGVDLEGFHNLVSGNNVTDPNGEGIGIFINGNSNSIADNTITEKSDGISVFSGSYNTVSANTVTNCSNGIVLEAGFNNTFTGNTIAYCRGAVTIGGVYSEAANNTLYRNNFLNNTNQVTVYSPNYWDNGKEGNYWSDYLIKHPNASEIDNSGIGNTPYVIDANNTDHYPLMAPFGSTNPPLPSSAHSEPFPITWVVAAAAIIAISGIAIILGVAVYRRRFKEKSSKANRKFTTALLPH